jgi:hypothetical protein
MHPLTKLLIFDPKKVTTLYHSPYSPDLSPPGYFMFPKLKMNLEGLHFADVAEIQEAVTDELQRYKTRKFRQLSINCTIALNCIYANGAHFE